MRGQTSDFDSKFNTSEKVVKAYADTVEQVGRRINSAMGFMSGGMSKVTGVATYFTDALGNAWEKLKGMASAGLEGVALLGKMSERLGMTTQQLGGMEHAAALSGLGFEELVSHLTKLQRHLGDAANKGGPLVETLQQIGVNIDDIKDLNFNEQIKRISDGFRKFGNEADKTRIAMEITGRGGAVMKKFLGLGSEEMQRFTEEAIRMGIATSGEQTEGVRAAQRAVREYDEAIKGIGRTMAVVLAPILEKINKVWANLGKAVAEFAVENIPLFQEFARVVMVVQDAAIEAGTALTGKLGGALSNVRSSIDDFLTGRGFDTMRDTFLKGFYAIEFAASHWKDYLAIAMDGVEMAFLVLKRQVEIAMLKIELSATRGFENMKYELGLTDSALLKLGKTLGMFALLLLRVGHAVQTFGLSELIAHFNKTGEKIGSDLITDRKETAREAQLKAEIAALGEGADLETEAVLTLKDRIKKRWGEINDNLADFIDQKMAEFKEVFSPMNLMDMARSKFGGVVRRAIGMDKPPPPGEKPPGEMTKVGALEQGSKEAFSVIYGTQSAQEKALAVANQQLAVNIRAEKLQEKALAAAARREAKEANELAAFKEWLEKQDAIMLRRADL